MNCSYRSIWNDTTGTFVAVSENATSAGKKTSSSTTASGSGARFGLNVLAVAVMLAFGVEAYALPAGGVVAAGGASISSGAGSTTINQSTSSAAINWQSFNIAAGESVQFVQPSSSSVTLNRVLGADPSNIFGSLNANGKVFLVNPNGVLFAPGAQVNVGSLAASTLNITDADFMAGNYKFAGASSASVLNQGAINADGGFVALLGANVSNEGVISAKLGTVALAAGNAVTLDVAGDGLLNVTVNEGAINALAQNGGLIQADGGQVLLTAQAAGSLLQSAVNNTGVIQAQSLENHNGTIRLLGGPASTVSVSGALDVSGLGAGQSGGSVTATGQHVGLFGAQINASGDAGGGTVLIGGDFQGKNPAVQNAAATYMSTDASITADAVTQGNGGKVVLWADDSTRAYGRIAARAGAQGGDGGLIETSGHALDVAGLQVNTSAANGNYGTWLLDPADVTISSAATTGATNTSNVFAPNAGVNAANVNVSDLVSALGGSNVTVTTANSGASGTGSGDIDVNDAITWVASTTLTLNAERDVNVNLGAAITGTDGSLNVNAGRDVNVDAAIKTTTGGLRFNALNDVNLNAAATIITGDLTAIAGQDVNIGAAVSVTTGNLILRADNDGTGPGDLIGGTVDITCGSNCITIGTGALSIRFNPVTYASTASEILAYGLNLTGGGTLDAKAWVFGQGNDKVYDGLRDATVSGLEPDTSNTPPPVALGAVTNALFDTKDVGTEKLITFETTFTDPVFELFAPAGTTPGTYVTRADITPKQLDITANNASKIYGETATLAPTAFTSVGLVLAETIGSVTEVSAGTVATAPVGSSPYAITPSGATGGTFAPSNYAISYFNGELIVTPAPLTVTASNVTKRYGDTPVLSGFTTAGLRNGDTVASVTETSLGQPATASVADSPYAIVPTNAAGGTFTPGNYIIDYVNGVLTVTPAPLTITANNASKTVGETITLPATAFTTTALVNGENVGSVTETSPGTVATAPVATYAITPTGATGGTFTPSNYTIDYVNGVLTVRPVVVVPPIETTPIETTPIETTPGETGTTVPGDTDTGTVRDGLSVDENLTPPLVRRPGRGEPGVVLAQTPPQLLRLTPIAPPPPPPPPVVREEVPVVVPAPPPPKVYVAPVRPRIPERN